MADFAPTASVASSAMAAGLARLWVKFLPEIESRLTLMEVAVTSIGTEEFTDEQRATAHAAAHKLAGILGTFGLQRGTELARQAEYRFEQEESFAGLGSLSIIECKAELEAWVAELRVIIRTRNQ